MVRGAQEAGLLGHAEIKIQPEIVVCAAQGVDIFFVAGQDADTYIRLAGGFTPWARSGDVVVIKRVTHQWMKPGDTTIEEGDQVWVPKVVEHSFAWYMNIIGQTASIVSVAVTVVLLVIQLRK